MRVGIVGLGFMGAAHLQAWAKTPSAELAAVASSDPNKLAGDLGAAGGNLERGAERFDFGSASRYATLEEMLGDSSLDAVDLCTPTFLHADQAIQALKAGKHVLVEKPMALSSDECRRMIDAANAAERVLMVGQVLRFWPEYVAAFELVNSGELGALRSAFLRRKCGAPGWSPWLRDKARSGAAVVDLLVHDFDYCRQLAGMPSAIESTGVEDIERGVDVIEARLDYGAEGPQVMVSGGWHHPESFPFSMEFTLVCDGGTLEYRSGADPLKLHRQDGSATEVEVSKQDGFEAEMQAFVDACVKGSPPEVCPPTESGDAIAIALAADRSRQQAGKPVAPEAL